MHRHVVVTGLVAKAAGHAAAAGFNQLGLCAGDEFEHVDDGADRAEGFAFNLLAQLAHAPGLACGLAGVELACLLGFEGSKLTKWLQLNCRDSVATISGPAKTWANCTVLRRFLDSKPRPNSCAN